MTRRVKAQLRTEIANFSRLPLNVNILSQHLQSSSRQRLSVSCVGLSSCPSPASPSASAGGG